MLPAAHAVPSIEVIKATVHRHSGRPVPIACVTYVQYLPLNLCPDLHTENFSMKTMLFSC